MKPIAVMNAKELREELRQYGTPYRNQLRKAEMRRKLEQLRKQDPLADVCGAPQ